MGALAETLDPVALVREVEDRIAALPGGDLLFFDPAGFEWAREITDCYPIVRQEYLALARRLDEWPVFRDTAPEFAAEISRDGGWQSFVFKGFGVSLPDLLTRCCQHTAALVEGVPEIRSAMFSVLRPGARLTRHRGPFKGVLRVHLGLDIPSEDPNICGIRLFRPDGSSETHGWGNGELLVLDDSFEHEAWNLSDKPRGILFLDVVRPTDDDAIDSLIEKVIKLFASLPAVQHPDIKAQFDLAMDIAQKEAPQ